MLNKKLALALCLIANIAFAFPIPPTPIVYGNLLAAGAGQQTRDSGISALGGVIPSSTITGNTSGGVASASIVGQVVTVNVPHASAVALTTATPATVATLTSLPAGNWLVYGNVTEISSAGVFSVTSAWISTTATTLPDSSLYASNNDSGATTTQTGLVTPVLFIHNSTAENVYLSASATFASGTASAAGTITAIRIY
jgi:hypothetical protein